MQTENVELSTADGPMRLYVARPDGEPSAAVIVIMEAFGLNGHIEDVTRRVAAEGYLAVAPDLYHRYENNLAGYDEMDKIFEMMGNLLDSHSLMDVDAALGYLADQGIPSNKVGITGFCMGGRVTFLTAISRPVGAAVTYYGGAIVTDGFTPGPAQAGRPPRRPPVPVAGPVRRPRRHDPGRGCRATSVRPRWQRPAHRHRALRRCRPRVLVRRAPVVQRRRCLRRLVPYGGLVRRASVVTAGAEKIGVIGSGVMGSGIAQVMAIAGHPVVAFDIDPDIVAAAPGLVSEGRFGIQGAVARGKMTEAEAEAALARIDFTTDRDAAAAVDVIIEAVPERLDLKIQLFRDLDQGVPRAHHSGVQLQRLSGAGPGGGHRPGRSGDRLALGIAAAGDEAGRDREGTANLR